MSDETPNDKPERRGTPPPNPITWPGHELPLSEILARIPLADADLMRDVDEAQAGIDPRR
jgi:hypothetical protein